MLNMPLLGPIFWLFQTSYDNGWYIAICNNYSFWMLYFLWSRLGFGFETNILVIKVPNPYIAHELFCTEMSHVSTQFYWLTPYWERAKLCKAIAQFMIILLASRMYGYMWILCFLIVTKIFVFLILCNQENVFQSLINYEMQEHWHNTLTNLHIVNST